MREMVTRTKGTKGNRTKGTKGNREEQREKSQALYMLLLPYSFPHLLKVFGVSVTCD